MVSRIANKQETRYTACCYWCYCVSVYVCVRMRTCDRSIGLIHTQVDSDRDSRGNAFNIKPIRSVPGNILYASCQSDPGPSDLQLDG